MTQTWPKVRLGEVLHQVDNSVPTSQLDEIELAGVYSFGRGLFRRGPMSPAETTYKTYNRLVQDDFVISQPKAWEGALARVTAEFDGLFLSPVFPAFRSNRARLEPAYLEWYCRQGRVWAELQQKSKGMGARRESVSPAQFLSLEIPLPPLAEQQCIVARIEALAGQVEEAGRLRRQSSGEVERLWERAAAKKFDQLVEKFPLASLGDAVSLRGGGTPSKSNPAYWEGDIPWVTPKDMKVRELHDAIDHISQSATVESPAKLIPVGAVLVVVRGMILAHTVPSAILRVPAAINQDMKALLPKENLLPEFLCAILWAFNARILDLVEKSTHDTRKLETAKLLGTKIPIPPIEEQRHIVAELDALQIQVDALKKAQAETSAEMNALLPAVLDKAFRGKFS